MKRDSLPSGVRILLFVGALLAATVPGRAQNFGSDARAIGMGGTGRQSNMAWELVPDRRPYRAVPVPLGLFQVLNDLESFDPGSDAFNPSQALHYATNPIHLTFDRGISPTEEAFILDLVNGEIGRDLNAYRGFAPDSDFATQGLVAPKFGKTVWLYDNSDTFHGVFGGAGPYITGSTASIFDEDLIGMWASPTDVYLPNTRLEIQNRTRLQGALAFTGGYRAKFPLPGGVPGGRDGIYLAFDYSYLFGLHHEDFDVQVQLDTDDAGLLTLTPTSNPIVAGRVTSSSGRGHAMDVAAALVLDRWDFTVGIDGLGNHIDWRDPRAEVHTLTSAISGLDFVEIPLPPPPGPVRVELPIRYSGAVGYHADRWSIVTEMDQGFRGFEFSSGLEYRLGLVDLRGGGRYSRELWQPAGGAGLNLIGGFGIDMAFYGTTVGVERNRKMAMALSLRFMQDQ